MKMMHWVAVFLAALFLAAPAAIQADEAATQDTVVKAWDDYKTANDALTAKRRELVAEYRKVAADKEASDEAKAEALKKYQEASKALADSDGNDVEAKHKAFLAEFGKAEITRYTENKDLLEGGLLGLAEEKGESAPAEAVKLYEAFLKHLPDARSASSVRSYYLPMAIAGTGDLDAAIKRSNELLNDLDMAQQSGLQVRIGDFTAAKGDMEGALKLYEAALKNAPEKSSTPRYVKIRTDLMGKDAPDFKSDTWFGGDTKSLAEMKGKVVVIDFWATWCGPCRVAMPGLDKIYKENKDKGMVAVGLTRVYKGRDGEVSAGYLPESSDNIAKVKKIDLADEQAYIDHVGEFKKLSGLSYPFCVGTEDDFKSYNVSGIPQMVIVDQKGKVAMVIIGSGNDAIIEACVKNLLKNSR